MVTHAYTLTDPDLDTAAHLAARASESDECYRYLIQDMELRENCGYLAHRMLLRLGHHQGGVWGLGDPLEAVAVWFRPGTPPPDVLSMLDAGLMDAASALGRTVMARYGAVNAALLNLHTRALPLPHWYLAFLGMAPGLESVETARALLQPVLDEADRDGLPCYAEAASPHTLAVLEALGFEPEARLTLDDTVVVLGMVRLAQPPSA